MKRRIFAWVLALMMAFSCCPISAMAAMVDAEVPTEIEKIKGTPTESLPEAEVAAPEETEPEITETDVEEETADADDPALSESVEDGDLDVPEEASEEDTPAILEEATLTALKLGASTVAGGTCGDNLTWTLDSDGLLTISGSGAMEDYNYFENYAPWYSRRTNIKNVTVESGVTSIGNSAFYDCRGLTSITIPNNVTSIGHSAFSACNSLKSMTLPFVGNKVHSASDTWQYPFGYIFGTSSYTGGVAAEQYYHGSSTTSATSNTYYIPTSLKSVTITGGTLPYGAFYDCDNLTSITISDNVTSIGDNAFYGCSDLTSVTIGDSVTNIGDSTFYICDSLTSITIPDSVTSIGDDAFRYCSGLTSVTIGDSVTNIGNNAFYCCISLTSITIPDSVTTIGNSAFSSCSSLESMTLPFTENYTFPDIFGGNSNIPTSLKSVTVTGGTLPYGAFKNCDSVASITIGDSVTSIGANAFYNCDNLTSITIPDSVTSIGEWAFYSCDSLSSIIIPGSITSIGSYAFRYCSGLTSITIPNSVTSIGVGAFSGCSALTDFTVAANNSYYSSADGVLFNKSKTELLQYIVSNRRTSYSISGSVTTIGERAFYDCGLTSVTIGDGVTSIGDYAFFYCSGLASVTIPGSVTSIGSSAFANCNGLTSVTIGDGVTSIGDYAFEDCNGLTSIVIPDSVTSIGSSAFSACSSLESMTLPFAGDKVHSESDSYQYPFGYIFGTSSYTGGVATRHEYYGGSTVYYIPASLKSVTITGGTLPHGAFYNCSGLTSVTIGNGVTSIGDDAFNNCYNLTSVTIGDSVTTIGEWAFYDCIRLTGVTIPDSVTTIGNYAFFYCKSLTSITIPTSVTTIGSDVFRGCSSLQSIVLPFVGDKVHSTSDIHQYPFGYIFGTSSYTGGVATKQYYQWSSTTSFSFDTYYIPASLKSVTITGGTLPYGAFYNCSGLTSVTIGNGVTSISDDAFCNCSGLTSVAIGSGVTSVGSGAFNNCSNLTSVIIGNSVTRISDNTFYGCSGLTSVTIPDSVTSIGANAFYGCSKLSTIYAMKNSYAATWAKNNGYTVILQEIPATAVTLPKSEMTLFIGGSQKLIPAIEPLHCTDDVIWKSAANTIVSVDSDGTIHGIDFGTTTIKVIVGEFSAACKVTVVQPVTSISLNQTNLTLDVTKTYQLTATVYPDDANNPGYEWSVDDPTVASVSETGLVTALKGGTTTVTATAVDGSGVAGTCTVTVIQSVVSIDLNKTSITLDATKSYQLEATVNPSEASNKKIEWSVDDPTIATVSETGFITALKRGTSTVTATAVDGSGVSKSCTVIVLQPVTSISLNKTSLILDATQTYQLAATVYPGDANNPKYEWSVINPTIATVSEDGLVTALSKGTTIVTASALDGSNVTKSCTITVEGYAVSDVSAFESPHNYSNNCDDFWVYTVPDAGELKVTFDSRTNIEEDFDFLYIYDGNNQQIGKYTGSDLAGETVTVPGDTVKIKLVSDSSGTEWGFKVSKVITGNICDLNGDKKTDSQDLAALARHVAKVKLLADTTLADVNGDGDVNAKDLTELARLLK